MSYVFSDYNQMQENIHILQNYFTLPQSEVALFAITCAIKPCTPILGFGNLRGESLCVLMVRMHVWANETRDKTATPH